MGETEDARDYVNAVVQRDFLGDQPLGQAVTDHDQSGNDDVVLPHGH
jgi:hypothetical protein